MRIKELKNIKGITMSELSKKSGVPKRTLEDIIQRNDCLVSNAVKIAAALDVSLDELCKNE